MQREIAALIARDKGVSVDAALRMIDESAHFGDMAARAEAVAGHAGARREYGPTLEPMLVIAATPATLDDVAAAIPNKSHVRFETKDMSYVDLKSEQARLPLGEDAPWVAVSIDPELNGLVIESLDPQAAAEAAARWLGSRVPYRIVPTMDRPQVTSAVSGGEQMWVNTTGAPVKYCTAGFSLVGPYGQTAMLTAGHCRSAFFNNYGFLPGPPSMPGDPDWVGHRRRCFSTRRPRSRGCDDVQSVGGRPDAGDRQPTQDRGRERVAPSQPHANGIEASP